MSIEDFPIKSEIVASGEVEGIQWASSRAPLYGAVNGYVRLPDGHPWLKMEYIENSVPWGEITYTSGNWIGFDSLHSGQYWPTNDPYNRRWDNDTVMNDELVIGWTRQLAQEAHDFAAGTYSI